MCGSLHPLSERKGLKVKSTSWKSKYCLLLTHTRTSWTNEILDIMMMTIGIVDVSCIAVAATVTMELCVCGKFADLECSACGRRGYCCTECQQNDWFKHAIVCQEKKRPSSRSRKTENKHRKSNSRESRNYTPSTSVCVCGKEAEYQCSGCNKQVYCSEKCQNKHWDVHKKFCIPYQRYNRITPTPYLSREHQLSRKGRAHTHRLHKKVAHT